MACEFQLSTSQDNKVATAKDYGQHFRSNLAVFLTDLSSDTYLRFYSI